MALARRSTLCVLMPAMEMRPLRVVIVNARNNTFEKVMNVGLYPWGTHIMDSKDNYCH